MCSLAGLERVRFPYVLAVGYLRCEDRLSRKQTLRHAALFASISWDLIVPAGCSCLPFLERTLLASLCLCLACSTSM